MFGCCEICTTTFGCITHSYLECLNVQEYGGIKKKGESELNQPSTTTTIPLTVQNYTQLGKKTVYSRKSEPHRGICIVCVPKIITKCDRAREVKIYMYSAGIRGHGLPLGG